VKRVLLFLLATIVIGGLAIVPFAANAGTAPPAADLGGVAQGGPTPTPDDPNWLGFATARDALSEQLNQRITLVQRYQWVYTVFPDGMVVGCTDSFAEGVEPPVVYAGWRYVITLLNGNAYEVRVSFDLEDVVICDEVTSGIGGDDDGGTVPGDIGSVAEGPLEVGAQVNGIGSSQIQYLNQAGMNWVKLQVTVGVTNARPLIDAAHGANLKILLSVLGDKNRINNASYQNDVYAPYVADLASAGADAIEVHNEPNIDREWPVGDISGSSYTNLLKIAYEAIKAANSSTIVISGAPAPTGFFGAAGCTSNGCNDDVFYRQMAQAGAAQYADCIGIHYNEGIVSPRVSSGDPRDNYPTRYFQPMLSRALAPFPAGIPACFTELGYLSPEGYGALPGNFAWGGDTSVAEQAQWLGEAVVLASQLGNVRLIVVFNLDFTIYGADPQAGYAIVRNNGTCPACSTIASVLQ
jgi:hypothetical protein